MVCQWAAAWEKEVHLELPGLGPPKILPLNLGAKTHSVWEKTLFFRVCAAPENSVPGLFGLALAKRLVTLEQK